MFEKYFNLTAKAFVKFCKNILICQQKLFVKMFNKYFNLNLRRYWNIGQPLTPSIPPSLLKHSFKQMFPGFFTALKSQKLDLCCSQSNNRLLTNCTALHFCYIIACTQCGTMQCTTMWTAQCAHCAHSVHRGEGSSLRR